MSIERIRSALKSGREIEVVARGEDRVMIAFEHPYRSGDQPDAISASKDSAEPQRDFKKACCYWYNGERRQSAVFNLENLNPLDSK